MQWHTSAEESAFVRVEVRHPDGQIAALTKPGHPDLNATTVVLHAEPATATSERTEGDRD